MEPTDALEKAGLQQGLLDFSPQGGRGAQLWQRLSELEPIVVLLDWFKGTRTGNPGFSHQIWGGPVNVPFNQSNDCPYLSIIHS